MNFSQLHERLRIEMLRRIDSGSLSATLLARQTGFVPAHISNFLNSKRKLSLEGLDKVLRAQLLSVADLYPEGGPWPGGTRRTNAAMNYDSVPLVDSSVAVMSAHIPSEAILEVVKIRSGLLSNLRDKCSAQRRNWDRFVAVSISDEEADLMQPVLPASAILLIDRHYNSTFAHSHDRQTVYAVRHGNQLRFRYVALIGRQLILTTRKPSHRPELLPLSEGQTSADLLVGRVFLAIVEL